MKERVISGVVIAALIVGAGPARDCWGDFLWQF